MNSNFLSPKDKRWISSMFNNKFNQIIKSQVKIMASIQETQEALQAGIVAIQKALISETAEIGGLFESTKQEFVLKINELQALIDAGTSPVSLDFSDELAKLNEVATRIRSISDVVSTPVTVVVDEVVDEVVVVAEPEEEVVASAVTF